MRGDLLTLVPEEAALLQSALETLERWAVARGYPLAPDLALIKRDLASYVASRAPGRVGATTRLERESVPHPGGERFVDTEEAALMLGLSSDALRKACRAGRFAGVARKSRGRWMILASVVEAEAAGKAA